MLESILHDVRYAARSLVRQPGVTALAMGILALGLGLNAAVLAVAYGVLWRPLPYPAADRLVTVARVYLENGSESGVFEGIDEWNRRLRTMRVAGFHARERVVRAAGATRVREVATVSEGFFEVIGVPAVKSAVPRLAVGDGRAVVSAALARAVEDETGRSAVGQAVTIGDGRYDVAAVMPAGFAFPSAEVVAWVADQPDFRGDRGTVGRLRDGVSLAQARADATRVVRDDLAARGASVDSRGAAVRPVEETLLGEVRPVLRVSVAAALLVLVVACANAATLLVGRSAARGREFAIRIALGSGLARLVRAALVEGLAIASGGLVLGLAAAWAGLRLFAPAAAGVLPRVGAVAFDPPVVIAGLALTLLVGIACGGASVAAARGDGALRGVAAATGSRLAGRLRAGLVAGQIALSIVLLSGAGLLVRTVERLLDEEGGFEPRQALTARMLLADTSFIVGDAQAQIAFVDTLLERVRGLPGVQAAGVGSVLPPDDDTVSVEFVYEDDRGAASRREIVLSFGAVTRGYFAALGTRLRDGRRFEAADNLAEAAPLMLSETAARFVYPTGHPVGLPLPYGDIDALDIAGGESPVIGVVDDMKYKGLAAPREGSMYVPWLRVPTGVSHLVVRTTGDPMALAPAVRDLIRTLDPSLPVPEVRSLADHVTGTIAERRLRALPAAGFAALALAVAMVGLFGALARAVVERRQELAIRAAVGASPGRLIWLVLRSAVTVTGAGLAAGLLAAAATGRGLASLLYGVGPYDAATFAAVAAVVVLVALAASAIPARRAARLDPMIALRAE